MPKCKLIHSLKVARMTVKTAVLQRVGSRCSTLNIVFFWSIALALFCVYKAIELKQKASEVVAIMNQSASAK